MTEFPEQRGQFFETVNPVLENTIRKVVEEMGGGGGGGSPNLHSSVLPPSGTSQWLNVAQKQLGVNDSGLAVRARTTASYPTSMTTDTVFTANLALFEDNGVFRAAYIRNNVLYYSDDGFATAAKTVSLPAALNTGGNSIIYAVLKQSSDGTNPTPTGNFLLNAKGALLHSTDLLNWTKVASISSQTNYFSEMYYFQAGWIACLYDYNTGEPYLYGSNDGKNWKQILENKTIASYTEWQGNANLIVSNETTQMLEVWQSSNMLDWTNTNITSNTSYARFSQIIGEFMLLSISSVNAGYRNLYVTSDGITWTKASNPYGNDFENTEQIIDMGTFYVLPLNSSVYTSSDMVNWTVSAPASRYYQGNVFQIGSTVVSLFSSVEIGDYSNLETWHTSDGQTWTRIPELDGYYLSTYFKNIDNNDPSLAILYAYTSVSGTQTIKILSSTDMANWTDVTSLFNSNNNGMYVKYLNDYWFVLCYGYGFNYLFVTSDGVNFHKINDDHPGQYYETILDEKIPAIFFSWYDDGWVWRNIFTIDGVNWNDVDALVEPNYKFSFVDKIIKSNYFIVSFNDINDSSIAKTLITSDFVNFTPIPVINLKFLNSDGYYFFNNATETVTMSNDLVNFTEIPINNDDIDNASFVNDEWVITGVYNSRNVIWHGTNLMNLDMIRPSYNVNLFWASIAGSNTSVTDIWPDFNSINFFGNERANFKAFFNKSTNTATLAYNKPANNSQIINAIEINDDSAYKSFAPVDIGTLGEELQRNNLAQF
ncbi:MAG: hypothetical protein FWC26_02510 [Fibromonadales bacterium]|nr:hypothetical protein [Fibromonadales bacterium]